MNSLRTIIVICSVIILVLVGYSLIFTNSEIKNSVTDSTESVAIEKTTIKINQTLVAEGEEVKIFSDNLAPDFEINSKNFNGASINGFILDQNIFVTEGDVIKFKLPFLLQPGKNQMLLDLSIDEKQVQKSFNFNLGLKESFDSSISESDLLLIPNSTLQNYAKSWYVQNSKLELDNISGSTHASLAFLYPFKDISVEFEFTPKGDVLNLAFYFLDSGRTVVIGNGNLKRMTLLRSHAEAIDGSTFALKAGQRYKAKIIRVKNNYKLFVGNFEDEYIKVIDYTDEGMDVNKNDTVGFSAWPGSGGMSIDNLLISTND